MGVSRQHFYDVKESYEEGGLEALKDQSRRKPSLGDFRAPTRFRAFDAQFPKKGRVDFLLTIAENVCPEKSWPPPRDTH